MPLAGDLSSFAIDEVIALLMSGCKSGVLSLADDGNEGFMSFERGVIVDAVHGSIRGSAALTDMLTTCSSGRFSFRDQEQVSQRTMCVDARQLAAMTSRHEGVAAVSSCAMPDLDERLVVTLPPGDYPALTPLQWVILAEIPRRCTLRHLAQDRDPAAVERALRVLLHDGLVGATGQTVPPVATGIRLTVLKGYTREDEVVALDLDIVAGWRAAGCFVGRVVVAGQTFAAAGREGLGRNVVMSEAACRLCGVRNAQEVEVVPVG